MTAARSAVRLCANARITGVAFFDFKHNQTGRASHGIDLHPILAFSCSTRRDAEGEKFREGHSSRAQNGKPIRRSSSMYWSSLMPSRSIRAAWII